MEITINESLLSIDDAQKDMMLLDFLREELDLTGTKNGCGIGACGACTVLIDDKPARACKMKLSAVSGKSVTTIEGMHGKDGGLHPVQQSFIDHGAIQCGFCTPGMVLTAHAFLKKNPNPTRDDIRKAINANLCRCTGYQQIVDAIEAASVHYR